MTWWTAGGASGIVGAYAPVGAANLAASYSNLANPGTYDAAPGVAPSFDTATGWDFNGSTQYLTTGITPTSGTWTALIRYSDGVAGDLLFGYYSSGAGAAFLVTLDTAQMRAANGQDFPAGYADNAPILTAGVYGFAGKTPYRNGVAEPVTISATNNPLGSIYIGAGHVNGADVGHANAKVQAFGIWNNTLTADQMAAVSAAMAALPTAATSPLLSIMLAEAAAGYY